MKNGYIVWNESNYGPEFFGVYKSDDRAFKQFRKVIRNRYGKCPRGDYGDILEWLADIADCNDSIIITKFIENEGKE